MEPLTALSVASSVVQFVDFAGRVVTQTIKVYRTKPNHETDPHDNLEKITHDLASHNKALRDSLKLQHDSAPANLSAVDTQIMRICRDSEAVITELLSALGRLRSSQTTLWSSFLDALKSIWNADQVEALRQTLDTYRQQISLYLLTSLRYATSTPSYPGI